MARRRPRSFIGWTGEAWWMSMKPRVRQPGETLGQNVYKVRAGHYQTYEPLSFFFTTVLSTHNYHHTFIVNMTFMPFILTGAIGTLTALDFLGFGLPAGSPSLGELVAQGKSNLQAPWLGMSAFAVLAIMLSLLVFIGESARDAFDPRK